MMKISRDVASFFLFIVLNFHVCGAESLPMVIAPVDKPNAKYDSPENAFVARLSSLIHRDIDWYFETLTPETVTIHKQLYQKAGLEPEVAFKLYHEGTRYLIIDKETYNGYVIVTGKSIKADGTIQMGASLFEQVDGQWKTTYPLVEDEYLMGRLQKKLDYIRPDEILSAEGRFFPSTFSRDWVARITTEIEKKTMGAQIAEEINILCVLGNITDLEGNPIAPDVVEFESLLANHVVKARNPRLMSKEQVGKNPHLSMYEGAVLLCSFNQYQLLKSLDSLEAESDITVFGRLKDNTPFQARVRIKTVPSLPSGAPHSGAAWATMN